MLIVYNVRSAARAIIESKSWKDAMRWRSETDDYGKQTPMKLLITNMPGLFKMIYSTYSVKQIAKNVITLSCKLN